jgi:hypothetical protein
MSSKSKCLEKGMTAVSIVLRFSLGQLKKDLAVFQGHWGPPFVDHNEVLDSWEKTSKRVAAYFLAVNRNKRSVTVNLKSEEGVAIVRKLASQADIFVENVRSSSSVSYLKFKHYLTCPRPTFSKSQGKSKSSALVTMLFES